MSIEKNLVGRALLLAAASLPLQASADTFVFNFQGSGVSGSLELTYGPATDAKYSQAFVVTGISGTFSDSNNGLGIVNAVVGPLEPIRNDVPEAGNVLAPNNFSRFAVAAGLAEVNNGFLTYDNLLYPGGSPQTAFDYPLHGGVFDIYGLAFGIGGGRVVNLWSNGTINGVGPFDYGVAVATHAVALDYVGGVAAVPEPSELALFASGLIGLLVWRRRAGHRQSR